MVAGPGLIDTSVVILLQRLDSSLLPDPAHISSITLAELSVGPLIARDDATRSERLGHLQEGEAAFESLPFDAAAARVFARVALSLRTSGRKPAARTFDALIAAIALANDLPLYTCNPQDFAGIEGLTVIAVPAPLIFRRQSSSVSLQSSDES